MSAPGTLTDLLISQTERKLTTMRNGIRDEIDRLSIELRLVEDAIERKRQRNDARPKPVPTPGEVGRFDGLPREALLTYVEMMNHPSVSPAEVRQYLIDGFGIERSVEAIRNGLVRLQGDGSLIRLPDKRFALPENRNGGAEIEAEPPDATGIRFESSGSRDLASD